MPKTTKIDILEKLNIEIPEGLEISPSPTNLTPSIKTYKMEHIDLNILFKFIKTYDGSRETLNSFIVNCNNAIDLASEIQTPILFKYILSQLEGKAEVACSIKEFYNWEQLKQFLKNQFSDRKHYSHLLTELQESKQGPTENVNQFALRVETHLSQLLTEISLANHPVSEIPGRTAAMEDLALHHFIIGLKPNLSLTVRCKSPQSLNEAVNIAICEERILQTVYRRPQIEKQHKPREYFHQPGQKPLTMQRDRPNYQNTQPPITNHSQVCRYCKNVGHSIDQCRKRLYNNRNRNNPSTSGYQPQPRVHYVKEDYGVDETDNSKNQ